MYYTLEWRDSLTNNVSYWIYYTLRPKKSLPWWVTGFCDRSGSFGLTMYRQSGSKRWSFKVIFEILLDIKDVHLLNKVKNYFNAGTIYLGKTTATYRISSVKELKIILDHFSLYPLQSSKVVTYDLWAKALHLILHNQHQEPSSFNYIMTIYAALGRGASKSIMQDYPTLVPLHSAPKTIDSWWLNGYLTLYCTFVLKVETAGWGKEMYHKYRHPFSIGFNPNDSQLAQLVAQHLGVAC